MEKELVLSTENKIKKNLTTILTQHAISWQIQNEDLPRKVVRLLVG